MIIDKSKLPYRYGVGAMIINKDKKVFVGSRIDGIEDAWQMPQGGIDMNENEYAAALREVYEEIGTTKVKLLAESKHYYYYDLPARLVSKLWNGKFRGQRQKWFLFEYYGDDSDINLNLHTPEFKAWKWSDYNELPETIVKFKRKLYEDLIEEFKQFL